MLQYLNEFRREVVLMRFVESNLPSLAYLYSLCSTLRHENIVCMKGFCYEPYSIVMEFMDLGSLHSYLKHNKNISFSTKVQLALDIASGMQFLHNTSPPIVHRDLKVREMEKGEKIISLL